MKTGSITDIPGIQVGHAHDMEALTGCTVILCPKGTVGGVDQRGSASGSRETDPLHPMHLVEEVHAIVLSGGSAFGLDSAAGVVRYLEERGVGFDRFGPPVPIVPAAILFDLNIGRGDVRPGPEMGYTACLNASADSPEEGNVGAGCGATVGKFLGIENAMKSGIGTAGLEIGGGVRVGAIAAVNASGDVIDPSSGRIIAGTRVDPTGREPISHTDYFADALDLMRSMAGRPLGPIRAGENTVIGVVATNAQLSKLHATKVAQMAHNGLARTVRPAHTMFDGDTIFVAATGEVECDTSIVGAFAAEVFAQAVLRAVHAAEPLPDLPSAKNYPPT